VQIILEISILFEKSLHWQRLSARNSRNQGLFREFLALRKHQRLSVPNHTSSSDFERFLAVFYPPAEYLVTTRLTEVAGHRFQTNGKVDRKSVV